MKAYWVYILSSQQNGTLYVGVTNDLVRRIYEHKQKLAGVAFFLYFRFKSVAKYMHKLLQSDKTHFTF